VTQIAPSMKFPTLRNINHASRIWHFREDAKEHCRWYNRQSCSRFDLILPNRRLHLIYHSDFGFLGIRPVERKS
jgi:hypothetical protein